MPRKIDDANIKNCPFCGEGSTHLQESSEPIYPHYRIVHECGIKGKKLKMRIETKWCETQRSYKIVEYSIQEGLGIK